MCGFLWIARNLRCIPAIQPISNKDLRKTASGYGTRIDPIYGTMTENANRLFSMPKTVLATDSRIVMNQHGKYVRKHQWLGSDAA